MKKIAPKKVAEFSELWPVIEANLDDVLDRIYIEKLCYPSRESAWISIASYAELYSWHPFEVIEYQLKQNGITIC